MQFAVFWKIEIFETINAIFLFCSCYLREIILNISMIYVYYIFKILI